MRKLFLALAFGAVAGYSVAMFGGRPVRASAATNLAAVVAPAGQAIGDDCVPPGGQCKVTADCCQGNCDWSNDAQANTCQGG